MPFSRGPNTCTSIQDDGQPPYWKNRKKSPYLSNALADCREIWQGDAYCPPYLSLKIRTFANPTAILKIEKPLYLGNGIADRHQIRHDDAI